ncbi:MAG: hypothetical protein ACRDQ5_16580 [Sciscionella sp.]
MGRNVEHIAQKALAYWGKARGMDARKRVVVASVLYTRGLGSFLSYLHLTDRTDVAPTQHAFASMWREAAMLLDRTNAGLRAIEYVRAGLAVADLADPAAGHLERIRPVLENRFEEPVQRVLGDHGSPLTAAALIGSGAEARILLAELLWKYRGLPRPPDGGWVVGTGGKTSYWQDQQRLQRAILPSCMGMDTDAEMWQLATEAILIWDELSKFEGRFGRPLLRAVDTLARIDGVPL